jgi:hypothetical protein
MGNCVASGLPPWQVLQGCTEKSCPLDRPLFMSLWQSRQLSLARHHELVARKIMHATMKKKLRKNIKLFRELQNRIFTGLMTGLTLRPGTVNGN